MLSHNFDPSLLVVFVSWEAVNEELLVGPPVLLHGLFYQVDSDLDWNNFSLQDNIVDQLAIWGAAISLLKRE